jgi:hypothetical protein
MTLTTSGKESTSRMSSLMPHKREEIELLKKNAELAERVAKLATMLAELEAAAQKKPSS